MALYLEQLLAEVLPSSIGWSTESRYFFGKRAAEVIHAPSHTPSSRCFRVEAANGPLLLARDTLFHGSIGRSGAPICSAADLATITRSIMQRLYTLDPDTAVIPGHAPPPPSLSSGSSVSIPRPGLARLQR